MKVQFGLYRVGKSHEQRQFMPKKSFQMTIIRSGPLLYSLGVPTIFLEEGALSEALASAPNINLVIAGIYYFFECFLNFYN